MIRMRLSQLLVEPGNITGNLDRMLAEIQAARTDGLAGIVFPELCVSGYLLGDRWHDTVFCQELEWCNQELRRQSAGLLLVYGNLASDPRRTNRDGRLRKYNACFAWYDGRPLPRRRPGGDLAPLPGLPEGCTAKTLHPDYRFFDDSRYFFSLRDLAAEEGVDLLEYLVPFVCPFPEGELALGLEICEDLWFADYRQGNRPLNVTGYLKAAGADLVLNVSASPWTPEKNDARHRRVRLALGAGERPVPFLYVNCVGVQDNGKNILTFDGSSTVYGADGSVRGMVPQAHVPGGMDVGLVPGAGGLEAEVLAVRPEAGGEADELPDCPARGHYLAACAALRSFDAAMGGKAPWVIGLSGGIDSTVVAALCACVIDPGRIIGVNMPGAYNSAETRRIARELAEGLGIRWHEIPIGTVLEPNLALLAAFNPGGFHRENIQAKIRGTTILSNIAGITGGIMTNNGNKVEIALGYATLYGDVNGAIAPIADLLKTEIFALARFLNAEVFRRVVIDEQLLPDADFGFKVPPTAELRPEQVDPMKWGYHDALVRAMTEYRRLSPEQILELYLEGQLWQVLKVDARLAERYGLDDPAVFVKDLEWFAELFFRGVFKRIQAPPIVVMSRSAFGYDFRESQLGWKKGRTWNELRARVLGQKESNCSK